MKKNKKQLIKTNILKNWLPTLTRIAWDIFNHFDKFKDFFD